MNKDVIVVSETPGGKEIGYRIIDGSPLYEIAFKLGGAVPKELQGGYTNIRIITAAIEAWVSSDKAAKRAETNARESATKAPAKRVAKSKEV